MASTEFVPTLAELDEAKLTLDKAIVACEDGQLHFAYSGDAERFTKRLAAAYEELDALTTRMTRMHRA